MNDIALVIPEITLLCFGCAVLLLEAFCGKQKPQASFWCSMLGGIVVLALLASYVPESARFGFAGTFRVDVVGTVLKSFMVVLVLLSFFYAREYYAKREQPHGEHYSLAMFATLGMLILVSANSLLTIYLGLELLSLSLYAMVATQRDSPIASEAAMKYFVLGALASGMLLYGMSFLYGVTGTLDLSELLIKVSVAEDKRLLLTFALVFLLVGISFKLGIVPFHMWVPDVYHGAATPITQFIGTAPKIAAFGMAMRLLVDGLWGLAEDWQQMLVILSVLSMAIGNIVAIAQSNLKRMLAYSTIAHMGYLLLGMLSATASGYAASMFYVTVYALMTMGAFGLIVLLVSRNQENDELQDFAGLARRSPWFAFMMLIMMFALAGVPPFAGFWAKWFVLKEVVQADYVWLATLAVIFSLIGAFYYLRVVKLMYFDEPLRTQAIEASQDLKLVLSVNGLAVLALGIAPSALMSVCVSATLPYLPW
ncbi:MAG TPA: NADH-quinone oxidoreductase subunit NuoN [Gammaproteobacteria bacterium]|nr:NADH-quinone oxidoreductase subunit NuoN [Gammaproteobacteria bacterium]